MDHLTLVTKQRSNTSELKYHKHIFATFKANRQKSWIINTGTSIREEREGPNQTMFQQEVLLSLDTRTDGQQVWIE